jgi:hypothetical protein
MFIPEDYKEQSAEGNYLKLVQGKQTIRIVGSVQDGSSIVGMVGWTEEDGSRAPHRWADGEAAPALPFTDKPKRFIATVVYNHATGTCQIWDITQRGIRDALIGFYRDPDWGDLRGYDVDVIRDGEGLDTTYSVIPKPKSKLSDEARAYVLETLPLINVAALFTGEDPFEALGPVTTVAPVATVATTVDASPVEEVEEDDAPW